LKKGHCMAVKQALKERYRVIVDVHLFLLEKEHILLGQRQNTGFEDGKFHVPAGHLEAEETVIDALIREAREELGISIKHEQVIFVHVMHHKSIEGRTGLFFIVREWEGEVQNMERDKCKELQWFDVNNLPENMVLYAKQAIQHYLAGSIFSLYDPELYNLHRELS
jgi:8-oxo-dGTP diphosphatase